MAEDVKLRMNPMPAKRTLLPLAVLLMSLAMVACAGAFTSADMSLDESAGETPSAEAAPEFSLPSATGAEVSLGTFAGEQNVVLVFYRGFW